MTLPDRVLDWMGKLPTTNARIAATIGAMLATTGTYLVLAAVGKPWEPSWEWLGFLVTMSGLDVTQFFAKRKTHKELGTTEDPAPTPEPPSA